MPAYSTQSTHSIAPVEGFTYRGEALRHVAMPLGGLGAGQISLGGDGGLRQWQIVNQINHQGFVPDSFFALRASCTEPPIDVVRVLQSREVLEFEPESTPLVNDNVIPIEQQELTRKHGVERTVFTGAYPFARITYQDKQLPVEVKLEAYSPFVPLNEQDSGLPAIIFTFTLRNLWPHEVHGVLGAALQNAVGWDGLTPIRGNRCSLYGGNINRVQRRRQHTSIVMENASLPDDHPGYGQMVLSSLAPNTRIYERWTTPEQFLRFIEGFNPDDHLKGQDISNQRSNRNLPASPIGPSATGETWNGGVLVPFWLQPDETVTIRLLISWHFPNRYVNFDQLGPRKDYGKSRFWLGNAYSARFADALEIVEYVIEHQEQLNAGSRAWANTIYDSTLSDWLAETMAAQGTLMRSPTTFWTEDGKFYGFEGSLGLSTGMWNSTFGGSCPLNCTHVWNYEQALSRLFPSLERTVRETELDHVQSLEGYIPHRTVLPLYLPQFWNVKIGGPSNPALDGMLGTILKCYREVRLGAGPEWLVRYWPKLKRLMNYIIAVWDPERDGVLEGEQPNTYDIAFYGANIFIGGLWLAALRAMEEMAKLQDESGLADDLHHLFEHGSSNYDRLLWNGEYYIQQIDPTMPLANQFGDGCLTDQLFGQWWAHLLELGYILPEEHVKTTLHSIVRYNFRNGFRDFEHGFRVFADKDDAGLLVCTWPHGGRPEIPVRYCDEVWTGSEYQVGAHCIMEGLIDEGLQIIAALRARYNGTRRNPYNEIECGDHYSRAMAGWSVLEALSGFRYNVQQERLAFAPAEQAETIRLLFITATGWGTFYQHRADTGHHITLTCAHNEIRVRQLTLALGERGKRTFIVTCADDQPIEHHVTCEGGKVTLAFAETIRIGAGEALSIENSFLS